MVGWGGGLRWGGVFMRVEGGREGAGGDGAKRASRRTKDGRKEYRRAKRGKGPRAGSARGLPASTEGALGAGPDRERWQLRLALALQAVCQGVW